MCHVVLPSKVSYLANCPCTKATSSINSPFPTSRHPLQPPPSRTQKRDIHLCLHRREHINCAPKVCSDTAAPTLAALDLPPNTPRSQSPRLQHLHIPHQTLHATDIPRPQSINITPIAPSPLSHKIPLRPLRPLRRHPPQQRTPHLPFPILLHNHDLNPDPTSLAPLPRPSSTTSPLRPLRRSRSRPPSHLNLRPTRSPERSGDSNTRPRVCMAVRLEMESALAATSQRSMLLADSVRRGRAAGGAVHGRRRSGCYSRRRRVRLWM